MIPVTIILIQSLDGKIARYSTDDLSWGSSEDKNFFRKTAVDFGTMIMGSGTYQNMPAQAFENKFSLVFTTQNYKDRENIKFFNGSPRDGLNFLQSVGKKRALLIGGGNLNNQFLRAGLVDEMLITVAPRIFAKGITGFGENELNVKLDLKEVSKISYNEILLKYKVLS